MTVTILTLIIALIGSLVMMFLGTKITSKKVQKILGLTQTVVSAIIDGKITGDEAATIASDLAAALAEFGVYMHDGSALKSTSSSGSSASQNVKVAVKAKILR